MFTVSDGQLWFNDTSLGSSKALYADSQEFPGVGVADGVIHRHMPLRIDAVFVVGGKVVGCESKKPQDLVDSTRCRRLARQMRTLLEHTDIPTLLLRGAMPEFTTSENMDVMNNLVCLQQLGVTLLPTPVSSKLALQFLAGYRRALTPDSRTPLSALRGTDEKKRAEGTLLRSIKGVGARLEEKLLTVFTTPLAVLTATRDELKSAGANATVANRIKEMVE